MNHTHDKIIGSMVGGAAGDALGYPIEFIYSFDDIQKRYGEQGVREYILEGSKALISDDTQMTLYTAEGLLYAIENDEPIVPTICEAYLQWFGHQTGRKVVGSYPSQLAANDELNQNRAPGNTCLSALAAIHAGKKPDNNSKGCGGIMRIAPVALYGAAHGWTLSQTAKLAGEIAEITHLHRLSTLASACCAAIIQQCASCKHPVDAAAFGRIVAESLDCVEELYSDSSHTGDFRALVERSLKLSAVEQEDWRIIEDSIGQGWTAEETLAIGIFSAARHIGSFEDCVACAVNHGGDSDSTGAVAGNIIGAILGYGVIPDKFTQSLQLRDVIELTANELCNVKSAKS